MPKVDSNSLTFNSVFGVQTGPFVRSGGNCVPVVGYNADAFQETFLNHPTSISISSSPQAQARSCGAE